MKTLNAGSRSAIKYVCVALLIIVSFSLTVYSFDASNDEQQHAVDLVKGWKAKQKSYVNVLGGLKQQKADFYTSKIKQRLVNIQDALDSASNMLDVLEVNQTVFDQMTSAKKKDLTKALSLELELGNLVVLTDNSQRILGENSAIMINNFTEPTYGEELLFRQNTLNSSLIHQMSFNSRPGTFQVFETSSNITRVRNRIAAGSNHVLVLMPNGKLYSTGVYYNGNLGRTSQESRLFYNNPVEGIDGLEILQIEAHGNSNLILTTKGIYSFGSNTRSQLASGGTKPRYKPTFVNGFNFNTRIIQIAMGFYASYAIDETGKLWAWGCNDQGQLGDRTWDEKNRPFSVYGYGALANQTVVKVCAGNGSALVLTSSGNLVSFGDNTYGQLGTGDYVSTGEPVLVKMKPLQNESIVDIQCGMFHNLVLTASGKVFTFGRNNYGQVGDGTTTNSNIPKQITGFNCTVTKIHTKGHVNFAVCPSLPGYFFSWGLNDIGQAGVGLTNPVSNVLSPKLVKYSAHPIVEFASNEDYSFIFLADGTVHATGACYNTAFFFDQQCLDIKPTYALSGPAKRFSFNANGLFTHVKLQNKMQLKWYQRKPVYFEMGDIGYMLKLEDNLPTRRNNGFNMYITNVTANNNVWQLIEYNETTNTGFPQSIHNTHVLKHGEYVFLFGGVVNDEISNKIYRAPVYDLIQSWELSNDTLPIPLASGMIKVVGDYVYIFGGIISIYEFNTTVDQGPFPKHNVSNMILRAPLSNISDWQILKDVIPVPLHSAFLETVGNYIYLFGGSSLVHGSGINIFRSRIETPTVWEMTFGLLPYYMSNTGVLASTDDKIYIFGGTNSSSASNGPYFAFGKKTEVIGTFTAIPETNIELNILHNTQFEWCKKYPLLCYQCSNPNFAYNSTTGYYDGPQFYEATNPNVCSSAGVCVGNDECQCTPGRFGNRCQYTGILAYNDVRRYADGSFPDSCKSYKNPTNSSRVYQGTIGDGYYLIQVNGTTTPIKVYCDMTINGGGWIAYYTAQGSQTVHLASGVNNPIGYRDSGYVVDLRKYNFTSIMYTEGSKFNWFTTDRIGGITVNDYIAQSGTKIESSTGTFGTWTPYSSNAGELTGPYYLYMADNSASLTAYTNSIGLAMLKTTTSNYLPVSSTSTYPEGYAYTGYRVDAGGGSGSMGSYGTISTGNYFYNTAGGVCFNTNMVKDCSYSTIMTVYLR